MEASPGVGQPVPQGCQSWMLPPSTGCEHGGYREGREGQELTRAHHGTNTHRKIKTCFKKVQRQYKGRCCPLAPTAPHRCPFPILVHPSLKKSFPVIYLYPSLFRVLAEAALALVDEAGGEQEVTLSHMGDGCAGSRGASTSQGSGTTFCFLPPFLACFLSPPAFWLSLSSCGRKGLHQHLRK